MASAALEEVGIDLRTLAVVMLLALISGVVFGLIPALRDRGLPNRPGSSE